MTAQLLGQFLRSEQKENFPFGIYHLTASGATTWQEYAVFIVKKAIEAGVALKAAPEKILPIPASAYPLPSTRPENSRLGCGLLEKTFQVHLSPWQSEVGHALKLVLQ